MAFQRVVYFFFLQLVILLSGSVVFSVAQPSSAAGQNSAPPNIVLFVADDLAAVDTGPYGNGVVRTPHLDRLAKEGLLFSQAFAASPTCSPSRAALHTGMMPFRNGAHANHTGIKEGVRTLPAYLRELGYRTALAGKYHIGPMQAYPFELIGGTNVPEPGHEGDGALWTDLNLEPVEQWLRETAGEEQPFLLVVNDHSPHVIWPEEPAYDPDEVDVPARHIDTPETRRARARYYTDITKMDGNVGRLLESLEKLGLTENTVVIFTADQGPQWAFGKWNLYDYGVHVPLLVRWPDRIEAGATDALVSLVDLLPTMIELGGGIPPVAPQQIDGRSFLPVLLGREEDHRREVFASHTGDGTMNRAPMRMLRTRRYKYILNLAPEIPYHTHMNKAEDHDGGREYWKSWIERSYQTEHAASVLWRYHNRPAEELYDVQADPDEARNLAADPRYGEIMENFRRQLSEWRHLQGDAETGPYQPPKREHTGGPIAPYVFE